MVNARICSRFVLGRAGTVRSPAGGGRGAGQDIAENGTGRLNTERAPAQAV